MQLGPFPLFLGPLTPIVRGLMPVAIIAVLLYPMYRVIS